MLFNHFVVFISSILVNIINGQSHYDVIDIPLFYEEYMKYDAIEAEDSDSCRITYESYDVYVTCSTDVNCYLKTQVKNTLIDLYQLNINSSLEFPCQPMDKERLPANKSQRLNAVIQILRLVNETVCEFSSIETLDVRHGGLANMGQLGGANCRKDSQCPYQLKFLNIDTFKIEYLTNDSFCQFEKLEFLGLDYCGVRAIEAHAFIHLRNLKEINLSGNELTDLPADLFTNNALLQTVTLNHNKLQLYPFNAILPVSSLRYLFLNNNSVTTGSHPISFPSRLEHLTIDRNKLKNVSLEFANLKNLTILAIDRNTISDIDENAFVDLQLVKIINLANNEIEILRPNTFRNNLKLEILRAENNKLLRVPPIAHLESLRGIELTGNRIKFINRTDFINCTRLNYAGFPRNGLIYIEPSSFDNVRLLRYLFLTANRLTQLSVHLTDANIMEINLDYNNFTSFSYQMFPHSLVTLSLANNQIESIEPFDNTDLKLSDLVHLALNSNRITTIKNLNLPVNLQTLDLRRNRITTLCQKYFIKTPKTITYYVAENPIKCTCENKWTKKLRPFPVSTVKFEDVNSTDCQPMFPYNNTSVILAQLSDDEFLCQSDHENSDRCECPLYENIQCELPCPTNCTCLSNYDRSIVYFMCNYKNFKQIPSYLKRNSSYYPTTRTIVLDLSGNFFARVDDIDCGNLTTALVVLNLYNCSVKSIRENAFDKLVQLKILILAKNQLEQLPVELFNKLTQLRHLHLSDNRLTQLADDAFISQIYLQYLSLHNNNFHRVNINEIRKISSLINVTLDNNPWSCECAFIEPFRAFVVDPLTAVSNKLNLNCTENGEEFNISNFNLEKCLTQINLTILIVSLTFGTAIALTAGLMFKWRYELQVLVYARYGRRIFYRRQPEQEVEGKQYDAFVAYNSDDTNFLINDLMPGLEAIANPYRLCIHERDFPAGSYIQDSIIDAIAMSSRTIVVLSENFVSSGWCRFEFKSAHMQMLQDRCPRILVIVLGEVPGSLDPEMKLYLKTNTYLQWGERLFWQKLYYAMPDQRVTTPPTDIMPMRDL